jgi:SLA1 homology domain 1, SHD1
MKRLRKATHVVLAWTIICLLFIDPAAACRLLRHRRCCGGSCVPDSCSLDVCCSSEEATAPSAGVADSEPAPVDIPPAATTGGGEVPKAPIALDASPIEPTRPAVDSNASTAISSSKAEVAAASPLAAIIPAKPRQPTTMKAKSAPPASSVATPRQPAQAAPTPGAAISPPSPATATARPVDSPSPTPSSLTPRPTIEPAINPPSTVATANTAQPPTADVSPNPSPGIVKRNLDSPMPPMPPSQTDALPRTPAQPSIARPADAVKTPAFPPVDDDPFAVRPTPATVPTPAPPQDDDPFAPLPQTPAPQPKAKPPIAAEPTKLPIADSLGPGADGRLPVREWIDNSGQFRVKARLVLILDGKVRLLKETGRTTTVLMERLSAADREYVSDVVARFGIDLTKLDQFAAR